MVNPTLEENYGHFNLLTHLGSSQLGIHGLQFLIDPVHGLHLRGFWEESFISQGNQEMIGEEIHHFIVILWRLHGISTDIAWI